MGMAVEEVSDLLERHKGDLEEVRKAVEETAPGLLQPQHDDIWLLRFLVHSTPAKATARVRDMLEWRRDNGLDEIADHVKRVGDFTQFPHFDVVTSCIPMEFLFGFTLDGVPFGVERWGLSQPKRLLELIRPEQYMEFCLYRFEFLRLTLDHVVRTTGKFHKFVSVVDVQGASMAHCHKPFVDLLKRITKTTELHYRELLGKVLIVNASTVFTMIWKMFRTFLPERTLEKVSIERDPLQSLPQHIALDAIPSYLCGSGPDACPPHILAQCRSILVAQPKDAKENKQEPKQNDNAMATPAQPAPKGEAGPKDDAAKEEQGNQAQLEGEEDKRNAQGEEARASIQQLRKTILEGENIALSNSRLRRLSMNGSGSMEEPGVGVLDRLVDADAHPNSSRSATVRGHSSQRSLQIDSFVDSNSGGEDDDEDDDQDQDDEGKQDPAQRDRGASPSNQPQPRLQPFLAVAPPADQQGAGAVRRPSSEWVSDGEGGSEGGGECELGLMDEEMDRARVRAGGAKAEVLRVRFGGSSSIPKRLGWEGAEGGEGGGEGGNELVLVPRGDHGRAVQENDPDGSDLEGCGAPKELYSGWLAKKHRKRNKWTRRFFKLYRGELAYYRKSKHTRPIRVVSLYGYTAKPVEPTTKRKLRPYSFRVFDLSNPANIQLVMSASSSLEMAEWVDRIRQGRKHISNAAAAVLAPVMDVAQVSDSDHDSVLDDSEFIDIKAARRASQYSLDHSHNHHNGHNGHSGHNGHENTVPAPRRRWSLFRARTPRRASAPTRRLPRGSLRGRSRAVVKEAILEDDDEEEGEGARKEGDEAKEKVGEGSKEKGGRKAKRKERKAKDKAKAKDKKDKDKKDKEKGEEAEKEQGQEDVREKGKGKKEKQKGKDKEKEKEKEKGKEKDKGKDKDKDKDKGILGEQGKRDRLVRARAQTERVLHADMDKSFDDLNIVFAINACARGRHVD